MAKEHVFLPSARLIQTRQRVYVFSWALDQNGINQYSSSYTWERWKTVWLFYPLFIAVLYRFHPGVLSISPPKCILFSALQDHQSSRSSGCLKNIPKSTSCCQGLLESHLESEIQMICRFQKADVVIREKKKFSWNDTGLPKLVIKTIWQNTKVI